MTSPFYHKSGSNTETITDETIELTRPDGKHVRRTTLVRDEILNPSSELEKAVADERHADELKADAQSRKAKWASSLEGSNESADAKPN